jgi:hypothetical protein
VRTGWNEQADDDTAITFPTAPSSADAKWATAQNNEVPTMNLPLQTRAVSRGFFPKSRMVRSSGGVVPSWLYVCDPPLVACSCQGGNGTVACCSAGTCSCDGNNNPGCLGFGPLAAPTPITYSKGASGHCHDATPSFTCTKANDITCFGAGDAGQTCGT